MFHNAQRCFNALFSPLGSTPLIRLGVIAFLQTENVINVSA